MSKGTRVLCLIGGLVVFVSGVMRVIKNNEWTLAIIGFLILAFTVSGFFREDEKDNSLSVKGEGDSGKQDGRP
ncbi:hypothetical protein [Thermodesulforhabdus norvegica]|uniref:Uncharacterized protein n=1 Tax=Thermodesulforhabdus norvegica TaxID=39841 RepID=A0A1I4UQN0_9BACT|nr:hypothetical protein [Thermodesulforhabdus norvegica]SFM91050.1 hypothetical protein SAMN05660836_01923 [Thermodesulforhabdus norvegica]